MTDNSSPNYYKGQMGDVTLRPVVTAAAAVTATAAQPRLSTATATTAAVVHDVPSVSSPSPPLPNNKSNDINNDDNSFMTTKPSRTVDLSRLENRMDEDKNGPNYKDQMRVVAAAVPARRQRPNKAVAAGVVPAPTEIPLADATPVSETQILNEERMNLEAHNRMLQDELEQQREVNRRKQQEQVQQHQQAPPQQQQQQTQPQQQPTTPTRMFRWGLIVTVVLTIVAALIAGIYCGTGNCSADGSADGSAGTGSVASPAQSSRPPAPVSPVAAPVPARLPTGEIASTNDNGYKFVDDLNKYYIYNQDIEKGYPTVAATSNTINTNACWEFCAAYNVAIFASDTSDDSNCNCYQDDGELCILPVAGTSTTLADQLDRRHKGEIYTKMATPKCEFDLCQADPDNWFCLTAYRYDVQEVGLPNAVAVKVSETVATETACLIFCFDHDVVVYFVDAKGDDCLCYDQVACLLSLEKDVDKTLVARGTMFARQALTDYCAEDYCDVNTNDRLCFTGRKYDLATYWVSQSSTDFIAVPISNATVYSANDCLEHCAAYAAVAYIDQLIQGTFDVYDGPSCLCYGTVECLVPLGQVDKIVTGNVYVKNDTLPCPFEYCDKSANDDDCS